MREILSNESKGKRAKMKCIRSRKRLPLMKKVTTFLATALMLLATLGILQVGIGAGCPLDDYPYALQPVVQLAVNLIGPQHFDIPAAELGLPHGYLHIDLPFQNFKCGGDDMYSNWWLEMDHIWFRLFDAGMSVPVLGHVNLEVWDSDVKIGLRGSMVGHSLCFESSSVWLSDGFGIDIEHVPGELEQLDWLKGWAKDELLDQFDDKVIGEVNKILSKQAISNLPVVQSEFSTDTLPVLPQRGGYTDTEFMTKDINGHACYGWAANLAHAVPMPYSPNWKLAYFYDSAVDLGDDFPKLTRLKVTARIMIKERAGSDQNKVFGFMRIGSSEGGSYIELKPGMFPVDYKWYYITIPYTECRVRRDASVLLNVDFTDQNGVSTGLDFIKVDYVRFHYFDWD